MSKELEAFGRLVGYDKESRGVYSYTLGYSNGKTRTLEDVIKDIDIVTNALQPISNDEVKEVLNRMSTYQLNITNTTPRIVDIGKTILFDDINFLTSYISQLESKVDEIEFANPLQFFYDVSRGNKFEYNDIKIFYNKEYETYSLNDERVIITPKTVSAIIKSCMKASDK